MPHEVTGSKPARSLAVVAVIDWLAFKEYLDNTSNSNTARIRLFYAKKFYHVVLEDNAHDLLTVEGVEKRLKVMKSLTVL